jgi:hypothetical protein
VGTDQEQSSASLPRPDWKQFVMNWPGTNTVIGQTNV